ncbi:type I-E CRISPR-associated endonuclease Cas1e [Methanoregula sp.]|uniref:type I-E CRISPR-associated endonuclease Cas1e n=1 Tax=Methanoregula sp. TaxID=2052170 RepID=UPI0025D85615|nr:type I-E CRISPR-associated endonuclease Cas1e [Methanoregula sp.]
MKERLSLLFLEKGELDVIDGAFVLVDKNGIRTQIPVGGVACLMLEPGTRVSHAAVVLAARVGCLLVWVGEAGVRFYSSGHPGGARSDRLLYQAQLALDNNARLKVARKMFEFRFREPLKEDLSVEQLRGMEGVRVRQLYEQFAEKYQVPWTGRRYNPKEWGGGDVANRCLSSATACLYGVTESAILAAGYAPAIGFVHSGSPLSFVYDIADLFKTDTIIPIAFDTASKNPLQPEREVRLSCRDMFRQTKILERLIPTIEVMLSAGGLSQPEDPDWTVPPAIPVEKDAE